MSEDYYTILGVDKDCAPEAIRQAYRSEAKKSHPDASGTGASAVRFRAVEEAYDTLRDRERRAAYDQTIGQQAAAPRRPVGERGSAAPFRQTAGPRSAEDSWGPRDRFGPGGLGGRAGTVGGTGFGGLFEVGGWAGLANLLRELPFLHHDSPQSPEPLLEVLLSAAEADRGTSVSVEVPVARRCPDCGGFPSWEGLQCPGCAGKGVVRSACAVTLDIPPGVHDGAEYRCEVGFSGGREASFRVRVLVESW